MSIKLKALGLGLLAILATSAFTVLNASANTPKNSHFTSESHHVVLKGTDAFATGSPNVLRFHPESGGAAITCTHATYHGTQTGEAATTSQSVQVRPHYTNCATEGGTWGSITVDVPTSCGTNVYEFTSGNPGTIHVNCEITITHGSTCTIKVPPQTLSGATYTTAERSGKHSLIVDINTGVTSHYEAGFCIFLGTTHTSTMTGSSAVWGENSEGGAIGITHT